MTDTPEDSPVECLTCHRPLVSEESRARGQGPVCQAGLDHIARHGHRHRRPTGDQLTLDLHLPDPKD